MEFLQTFLDLFLNLDELLFEFVRENGAWTYGLLFLVIFMETGLVITPFLPGDSLLFAAGAIARKGDLNVFLLFILLFIAAIIGDTVNYSIGHRLGVRIFETKHPLLKRVLKPAYLEKTEAFYEKYGGRTIVLARFVPIVRTFAPFVAGVGTMAYNKFITYNVLGAFIWTSLFIGLGYAFSGLEIVEKNFELVIFGIIGLSVLPMVYEYWKARQEAKHEAMASE